MVTHTDRNKWPSPHSTVPQYKINSTWKNNSIDFKTSNLTQYFPSPIRLIKSEKYCKAFRFLYYY